MWSFSDSETHKGLSPNNARPRVLLREETNENGNFIGSELLENDHTLYMEMGYIESNGKLLIPPYDYERMFLLDSYEILFFLLFDSTYLPTFGIKYN